MHLVSTGPGTCRERRHPLAVRPPAGRDVGAGAGRAREAWPRDGANECQGVRKTTFWCASCCFCRAVISPRPTHVSPTSRALVPPVRARGTRRSRFARSPSGHGPAQRSPQPIMIFPSPAPARSFAAPRHPPGTRAARPPPPPPWSAISLSSYAAEGGAARRRQVSAERRGRHPSARHVAPYAAGCDLPRLDCDPVGGRWTCSSHRIGAYAPRTGRGVTLRTRRRGADDARAPPRHRSARAAACEVTEPTLSEAQRAAMPIAVPRRAATAIPSRAAGCARATVSAARPPGSAATDPPPAMPPAVESPAPRPPRRAPSGTLRVEAESGALSAGWEP